MTIPKAIEILSDSANHNTILLTQDDKDALKLGIEALRRIQYQRTMAAPIHQPLLKGEHIV